MTGATGDDALLAEALRRLRQDWADTAARWRDRARDDFARDHLDGIEQRTRTATRAMTQIDLLISEARRQCR